MIRLDFNEGSERELDLFDDAAIPRGLLAFGVTLLWTSQFLRLLLHLLLHFLHFCSHFC